MTEEKKYPEPIKSAIIVSGVVIKKDNKYLLVQEKQERARELWNLPAGKVEKGISVTENAVKEAREETGFDVKIIRKIGVFHENGEEAVKHAFEADIISGELKFPKEELLDAKWFTLDEIKRMKNKLRSSWVIDAIELMNEKQKTDQYLDSWKRCQADFENFKKDQEKAREEFAKFSKMDVISQILPVLDNFEASLSHVPEKEKNSAWVAGITHIKRQIEDMLRNNGVEEIAVKIGDKFDPEVHEAVAGKGEKVKKVMQKGYRINRKILRAVRVEVE
jgi:molecular chaperone GrpE